MILRWPAGSFFRRHLSVAEIQISVSYDSMGRPQKSNKSNLPVRGSLRAPESESLRKPDHLEHQKVDHLEHQRMRPLGFTLGTQGWDMGRV